jgi:outer membrane protein TolC
MMARSFEGGFMRKRSWMAILGVAACLLAAPAAFPQSPPSDAMAAAREQRAKAAQTAAQRDALKDSIRGEVEDAFQSLRAAESALASTARGLDAAEESYRVRRELFQHGRATSVELTDAETELTQARLDAISARIDHREARVRLDHATGRDVALAD